MQGEGLGVAIRAKRLISRGLNAPNCEARLTRGAYNQDADSRRHRRSQQHTLPRRRMIVKASPDEASRSRTKDLSSRGMTHQKGPIANMEMQRL
jgi:hypothetical protein